MTQITTDVFMGFAHLLTSSSLHLLIFSSSKSSKSARSARSARSADSSEGSVICESPSAVGDFPFPEMVAGKPGGLSRWSPVDRAGGGPFRQWARAQNLFRNEAVFFERMGGAGGLCLWRKAAHQGFIWSKRGYLFSFGRYLAGFASNFFTQGLQQNLISRPS
jgi:hypothetical protein